MMRTIQMAVAFVAVLIATAGQVQAGILQYTNVGSASGSAFERGLRFEVTDPAVTVTRLGLLDVSGDGFSSNYRVTLWNDLGGLLHRVTMDGTEALEFGNLRFRDIQDTTFVLGERFRVSFSAGDGNDSDTERFLGGLSVAAPLGLSIIDSAGGIVSGTNLNAGFINSSNGSFPNAYSNYVGGATFEIRSAGVVPEPTSIAVFAIGACVAGLGTARRRRREKQQVATA